MKRKLFTGEIFNNWIVVDPTCYRKDNKYYILCFDETNNILKYVNKYTLINGKSKSGLRCGHSTRKLKPGLPLNVYHFKSKSSKKKFRVATDRQGKYVTWGYFSTVTEADEFAKSIRLNRG